MHWFFTLFARRPRRFADVALARYLRLYNG